MVAISKAVPWKGIWMGYKVYWVVCGKRSWFGRKTKKTVIWGLKEASSVDSIWGCSDGTYQQLLRIGFLPWWVVSKMEGKEGSVMEGRVDGWMVGWLIKTAKSPMDS